MKTLSLLETLSRDGPALVSQVPERAVGYFRPLDAKSFEYRTAAFEYQCITGLDIARNG